MLFRLTGFFFLAWSISAQAADPCYYFLSAGNNGDCGNTSSARNTTSGGAYPTFSDGFNLNPSSIPTKLTPIGVEIIGSSSSYLTNKPTINGGLIKGWDRVGSAISTQSENTFFNYNLKQSYIKSGFSDPTQSLVSNNSATPSFNIGTAVSPNLETYTKVFTPNIGVNVRYDEATNKFNLGYGFSISSQYLNGGVSIQNKRESSTQFVPASQTTTYHAGVKIQRFQFEYAYIRYVQTLSSYGSLNATSPMSLLSTSLKLDAFLFAAAYRHFTNVSGSKLDQFFGSIQTQITRKFVLAGLYNYIPGSMSAGIQVFF